MYRINVLAFRERGVMDDPCFHRSLQQCSLSIEYLTLPLPAGEKLPAADINLYVFSESFQQAAAEKSLPFIGGSNVPTLCLLPVNERLDERWLACFQDFMFWPCGANEFKTRLLRIAQPQRPAEVAESHLLEEFSALNLIGKSARFLRTVQLIKRMSSCHAPVLIQGETGTGKENAARAIHYLSDRREQGFVPVNCAAIPDELLESELFGYEKGAFTDAKQAQTGLVAFANHGTLFLDEVDSLTPKAQAALLRFLQTQEYRPLGARQTLHADVRILAATNADLNRLVADKQFREDLYFRLNVLNIVMPPLRERLDDIAAIANSMLARFAHEYHAAPKRLDRNGLHYLQSQPWPGNIRELENCLLRASLLSTGPVLQFSVLNSESALYDELQAGDMVELSADDELVNFQKAKALAITQFESQYLQNLMQITQGNVSAAARLAGKERRALGRLLRKYAIDKDVFQAE